MTHAIEKKIKNIFAYLTPSVLSSVLPLITFPIMTRVLTPADYGIVALLSTFPVLIVNLVTCNVHVGAERYYFEYRKNINDLRNLINSTIAFLLLVFVLSAPVIFLLSNFLSKIVVGETQYGWPLFISYSTACIGIFITFYLMIYRNMEKGKQFSVFTISRLLVHTALSLIFVAGFRTGYIGLIYAAFFSALTVFCVLFWRFQKNFPFSFNMNMLIDNLKYGIPLLPTHFTSYIYAFFDKYMLRLVVSLSSVGIYSIAQTLSKKLFLFMTAVQSTFYPTFMKDIFDRGKEAARSIGRLFTVFTYISLFAILAMILFGEEFIHLLAPSSYYNSINVFLVLLCALATQTFGKIVGVQLAYVKKAYLVFPVSVVGVVVNVGLNLLLIPMWGAMGAGVATAVTTVSMNAIIVYISQGFYKIIYEKRMLFALYLNVFLSAALLIYFRIYGVPVMLKYGYKFLSIFAFFVCGVRANIITIRNMKIALNILTFRKQAHIKAPVQA
ncbi:lipopolysaccharide biosynthesis protein [Candidatus Margulisiibacteriota bacterium]